MLYQIKEQKYIPRIMLPICSNPFVSTFGSIANFLSILPCSNYEKEWLLSNLMLPLYVVEPETGPQYRFSDALYRDCCFMEHHEFYHYRDMTSEQMLIFLNQLLIHHTYIVVRTNERYIPHTPAYQRFDHSHRQMVYGMDWDQKLIYLMLHNQRRKYVSVSVTFEEFCAGFESLGEFKPLRLIRVNQSPYPIRWINIACDFQVYLEGRITQFEGKDVCFGIAAARSLMAYLEEVASGNINLDIRMISAYVDHKWAVLRKLELLEEQAVGEARSLTKEFQPVMEMAELSQNKLLHYQETAERSDLEDSVRYIDEICRMEKEFYPYFVQQVEQHIIKHSITN